MKINQTLESLSILTDDNKIFSDLSHMISKNFKKTLNGKGKIISFYEESEMPQRKYFLKFIKHLYEKQNNEPIEIKFAEYKTIKLNYVQQNTLAKVISVSVDFVKNEVIFYLNDNESIFFAYLMKTFSNCEYYLDNKGSKLHIKIKNDSNILALNKLLNTSRHLRFLVDFNYDVKKFESFKLDYNGVDSNKFKGRFIALANLFEDSFKELGCTIESDFKAIRESYLCLVKIYHPDRHTNKSDIIKNTYRKKFEQIQHAYESLKPLFKEQERMLSA